MQKIWIDGQPIFSRENMLLAESNSGQYKMERFMFQVFHGGKSDNFKPSHTQYQWCAPVKGFLEQHVLFSSFH